MDKEQQIRLNFLDEAEECLETIESVIIGFSHQVAATSQLDLALRAAHSVKGGAGMMGFMTLSQVAHRLEDFFKILRVRHQSTHINTEVEMLLLKCVDILQQVSNFHREGVAIEESWLQTNVEPIFSTLGEHLGEVQAEDENALLSETEESDSTLELVEEGMDQILTEFDDNVHQLNGEELGSTLASTAEKLITLAHISEIDPLIELCESIQQQIQVVKPDDLSSLAQEALNLWQRSHALIIRGSLDKIPTHIESFQPEVIDDFSVAQLEQLEDLSLDDNLFNDQLEQLADLTQITELNNVVEETDLEALNIDDLSLTDDLQELQNILEEEALILEEEALTLEDQESLTKISASINESNSKQETTAAPIKKNIKATSNKTIRVSVEQFYQFNNLFSNLILERNRINLRLEQVKNFSALMHQRMEQLESSNRQLRNWYDRASLEGILPHEKEPLTAVPNFNNSRSSSNVVVTPNNQDQFDALEMDRYSDLHLISQSQIETIVQLQEVSTDIEIGLQEIGQAVQELNQTSRELQTNVTQTQMIPFAEIVKPFPRLVRELSVSFDKQVNLEIEGETTLLDRSIIEALNAPLMHLIRNAFDHGIEDAQTRIAQHKWPEGKIKLNAVNKGTQIIITVSDDGSGINLDKICTRLRKMGIRDQEIRQMSSGQILDYIFQPSFSTKEEVTELSGRGVGMDVVRTSLQEIRGEIEVDSQLGKGTTFTLKVPYALSIIRVMVVERAGLVLAIPVNNIRQIIPLSPENLSPTDSSAIIWQEQTIPIVYLEENLTFNRQHKSLEMNENPVIDRPTVLIIEEGDKFGAIQIDRYWGEQEVSIRSIDSPIPLPQGFGNSMILGDGRVLPVVDPMEIYLDCINHLEHDDRATLSSYDRQDINQTSVEKVDTILVVDDSINVRRYLALTLERAGYQVEQAKDGQEAVDKILAGLSIAAVICDIEMPRLDGYGFLEEVKGKPEFKSLPIAMLTSRSNDKHRKLAMNLGASAYFSKPYNEQELLTKIGDLINH